MRMPNTTPYELVRTENVQCPECGESPWLLCSQTFDIDLSLPAFYLCGFCGHVGQLGVGPVRRPNISSSRPPGRAATDGSG